MDGKVKSSNLMHYETRVMRPANGTLRLQRDEAQPRNRSFTLPRILTNPLGSLSLKKRRCEYVLFSM